MSVQNRLRGLFFLVLAVVCGLAAAALVAYLGHRATPTVPVYVVARNVAAGDPLKPDTVQVVKLPRAGVPIDVLQPGADLERAVAAHGHATGDVLRRSGIINLGTPDPAVLSARLLAQGDPNLRAMEVPVEAVAGMLPGMKAGDRVDVIAVDVKNQISAGAADLKRTILQGVPVIGVRPGGDEGAGVLVVAVTPEQAEELAYARAVSKVYVSLLPFGGGN